MLGGWFPVSENQGTFFYLSWQRRLNYCTQGRECLSVRLLRSGQEVTHSSRHMKVLGYAFSIAGMSHCLPKASVRSVMLFSHGISFLQGNSGTRIHLSDIKSPLEKTKADNRQRRLILCSTLWF